MVSFGGSAIDERRGPGSLELDLGEEIASQSSMGELSKRPTPQHAGLLDTAQ